jgi:UDP-glucose 4-epimerase
MNTLVTGCAGFVGSHLTEKLLSLGHSVTGVDCFTDYYAKDLKMRNLEKARGDKGFKLINRSLLDIDLKKLLKGVDCVFHQAAQPGVRKSWGASFEIYTENNILATQRLLEACKGAELKKFVYASSSSVYGDDQRFPLKESYYPKPTSPYGVSKLAAEDLCYLYWKNFDVPTVSLRYFTVYGPRQRPDMAFNKFIAAMLSGEKIRVFGDGKQTRDFTYVADVVDANIGAMKAKTRHGVYNIGGGSRTTVNNCIKTLEEITGKKALLEHVEKQAGDVLHTYADTSKARRDLGYRPKTPLPKGLGKQVEWMRKKR